MITFRALWGHLAERIGRHSLPIDPAATSLADLLEEGSGHHDLAKQLITALYEAGHCSTLDSPLSLYPALDRLGAIRHNLRTNNGDVDQLQMIDSISEELVILFQEKGELPSIGTPENRCEIITLPRRLKIRLPGTAS